MSLREALAACGIRPDERFALAAGKGDDFHPEVFESIDSAEAWLADKESWNCWMTGNPIRPGVTGRPGADDVSAKRILLLDFDPEKTQDDPEGVAQWKRDACADLADDVHQSLGERGVLVSSGRGHQVWLRVSEDVPRRKLIRWVADKFKAKGVKVDATQDPGRLMRLPGSINSRTGDVVVIVDPGTDSRIDAVDVAQRTEGWTEPTRQDVGELDTGPPTPRDQKYLRRGARKIWRQEPGEILDRSRRDFQLCAELLSNGAPESSISRLLWALPYGKANEDDRGVNYWTSTMASVYRVRLEEKARKDLLESLPAKLEEHDGYAFRDDVLKMLRWLKDGDMPEFNSLRNRIKDTRKVPMSELDKAIRKIQSSSETPPPDHIVRYCILGGEFAGWWIKSADGAWARTAAGCVQPFLQGMGLDATTLISAAMQRPWRIVSEAFQGLSLEGRKMNLSRAKWRIDPKKGEHPTWDQLLRVVGRGLDDAVEQSRWCLKNRIVDGAAYLLHWIASMAQFPRIPTAYLFIFGEQNIGKSMLHEMMAKCLLDGGYCHADEALVNAQGFNGELAGAVLCAVDERNVAKDRAVANNRIKAWVTADELKIHPKGKAVHTVPNTTHWIQTSNAAENCPIFKGDTRITAWEMFACLPEEKMDKTEMEGLLKAEAPAFLDSLLTLALPEKGDGRLKVPALETEDKTIQAEASKDSLVIWLEENPNWLLMVDSELVSRFRGSLPSEEVKFWTHQRTLRRLPSSGQKLRAVALLLDSLGSFEGSTAVISEAIKWPSSPKSLGWKLKALSDKPIGLVKRSKRNESYKSWCIK